MATSKIIKQTSSLRKEDIDKKWILIDADGIVLGRLASKVSMILRGKHKPSFTPHADCGDHVIIITRSGNLPSIICRAVLLLIPPGWPVCQ